MRHEGELLRRYVVLAMVLGSSVLLGGIAAAQEITIVTDGDYTSAVSDSTKSFLGNIVPMNSAAGNSVTIGASGGGAVPLIGTSSEILAMVAGGASMTSYDVSNNTVAVHSGQMKTVAGGVIYLGTGNVSGNAVTVNGGTISNTDAIRPYAVYGGAIIPQEDTGTVTNNSVTINDGNITGWVVGGGTNGSGDVTGNRVTINGGTIGDENVWGGTGMAGTVSGNSVIINGGTIEATVMGGYASDTGSAVHNTVQVTAGTIEGEVHGGYSEKGSATGNTVTITGGTFNNSITGGTAYGDKSPANDNMVSISGNSTKINETVLGAYADSGEAANNKVVITGGTLEANELLAGAMVNGDAFNNSLEITGGTIHMNSVNGTVAGSAHSQATGNTLTISGGTVTATEGILAAMGYAANNNTLTISGGTIDSPVIVGGYTVFGAGLDSDGSATGNTVNLKGNPVFTNASLYGGYKESGTADVVTGNTLNVYTKGLSLKNIANFANLNFYLPMTTVNGDKVLTLTGNGDTNLSNTTVKAGVVGNASLVKGNTVTLIDKSAGGTLVTTGMTTGRLTEGVSLDYDLSIAADGNNLVATITGVNSDTGGTTGGGTTGGDTTGGTTFGLKEQTKSLVETRMAELSFINSAADLAAGAGLHNALGIADSQDIFVAAAVNSLRNKTGSYVDSKGINLELGYARKIKQASSTLTIAPFLEYGTGHYDSYLEDANDTHGYGREHYIGAGILLRKDQDSGLYYEGSLRAGRISGNYESSDLTNSLGLTSIRYDTNSTYYAAHIGIGKVLNLQARRSLDLYGKYFYSHLGSDSVTLNSGETYEFESANSNRIRLGGRYIHSYSDTGIFYAGLGLEHEFSGSDRATYKEYGTASPTLKGTSGFMEIGWQLKPTQQGRFYTDLGLTGWVGRQRGITFNANLGWKF